MSKDKVSGPFRLCCGTKVPSVGSRRLHDLKMFRLYKEVGFFEGPLACSAVLLSLPPPKASPGQ